MRSGFTTFSIPLTLGGTRGVGLAGSPISDFASPSSFVALTGGQWSTGIVYVTSVGSPPGARTVAVTGSDSRTPNGAGDVTLVTPMRFSPSRLGALPAFAVLRVTFAPEPSAAPLLVAAGALAALAISRARSR